jgi:hypothetical protein
MKSKFTKEVEFRRCLRCDHEWIPTGAFEPKVCPKCKNPYWNVPRKEKKDESNKSDRNL